MSNAISNAPDRLLTPDEAAEVVGTTGRTIRRWIRQSRLPAIHLSERTIRIRPDDLETFIAQHRTS